jgi:hypothetical protein
LKGSAKYYWIALFSLLAIAFTAFQLSVKPNKDLDIFIQASQLIYNGKNCYDIWLISAGEGLKYFYSPLFAVLLFPIKDASQLVYDLVWLLVNYILVWRIFDLIAYFLPTHKLKGKKKKWFWFFCVAAMGRYIFDNLDLGQMTFILVWGSLESMRLVHAKKLWQAAALLALIINFKIIPLTLLVYLVYKREFKAAGFTVLFWIAYLFLPAIVLGFKFNNLLLHNWYATLSGTSANSIIEDVGRQSFSAFIPALFMNTPVQFSTQRNIADLSPETVKMILLGVRCFILLCVVLLISKPFKIISSPRNLLFDIGVICLVTPLFFPHQGKYSFLYLLPAYAYCIFTLMEMSQLKSENEEKKGYGIALSFIILSFILLTLTTDGLIGRNFSNLAEYLHFITFGALSLLICMAILKPKSTAKVQ